MNVAIASEIEPSVKEILSAKAVSALKRGGLFSLGESYVKGEFDHAQLDEIICSILDHPRCYPGKGNVFTLAQMIKEYFFNPQRGEGAFVVGERHYDLGNDLFSAMLDSSMSYTCAYWNNASSLEEAQAAKLELVAKKLDLKPGMTVLDIGCGWGNFAHHVAQRYGVTVTGVTVSKEQADFAKRRCHDLPVTIVLSDYATMEQQFDRVVSIEMIEAVGRKNLDTYFKTISRCLKSQGKCLIQAISTDTFNRFSHPAVDQYIVWLLKYIFPNGYLPTFSQLTALAPYQLIVEDVENLSTNYDKTLQAWRHNFDMSWPHLHGKYDDTFRRVWLYYLCGCMAFFRKRLVQVYQVVYSKGDSFKE